MTNLLSRLERLEREQPVTRQRIIWIEPDESQDQALNRVDPLAPGESPVFVGWKSCGHAEHAAQTSCETKGKASN
jgi:hypothetical protein